MAEYEYTRVGILDAGILIFRVLNFWVGGGGFESECAEESVFFLVGGKEN